MANMNYCRFHNTVQDVRDCIAHIEDDLSEEENGERIRFVQLCADVVFNFAGAETVKQAEEWAKTLPVENDK